jgi:hypothetical protein
MKNFLAEGDGRGTWAAGACALAALAYRNVK